MASAISTSGGGVLQAGAGTATYRPSGALTESVTVTGNTADTNEDTLWQYSLPANTLAVDGKSIWITATGTLAANADTKRLRVYFGSTNVLSISAATSNASWVLRAVVARTGATSQHMMVDCGNTTSYQALAAATPAETLSGAVLIKITGQDATGATANSVVIRYACVEYRA